MLKEQEYLARTRRALAWMLDHARMRVATGAEIAGDRYTAEVLGRMLKSHAKELAEEPDSPLYFGQLWFDENAGGHASQSYHIGRRRIADEAGNVLVIDWRAPVSARFYRASARERMGVATRRRFGWSAHPPVRLTGYEDEHLRLSRESKENQESQEGGKSRESRESRESQESRDNEEGKERQKSQASEEFQETAENRQGSAFLRAEIERPRVGPMRDIIATIQPEQDELVRADVAESLCVQGGPGTGKTAVGLHRAAYLLYAHRNQLRRTGVLVVGPNPAFLSHISAVLPALGEIDVRQETLEGLFTDPAATKGSAAKGSPASAAQGSPASAASAAKGSAASAAKGSAASVAPGSTAKSSPASAASAVKDSAASAVQASTASAAKSATASTASTREGNRAPAVDSAEAAAAKHHPRMVGALRHALYSRVGAAADPIVVYDGSYVLRVPAGVIAREVARVLDADLPYLAGRERLRARIVALLQRQLEARGESPNATALQWLSRRKTVTAALDTAWPKVKPEEVLFEFLSDPPDDMKAVRWAKPPRSARSARWTAADLVLLDEIAGLIDHPDGFGHIVVDEAQDLSPMQCRAIARRSRHGSLTVLGDLAQGTTPWAATSWAEQMAHLGKPAAPLVELTTGFRVPAVVLAYANRLLPALGAAVPAVRSIRSDGLLRVRAGSDVVAAVGEALSFEGSVAVIAAASRSDTVTAELRAGGIAPDERVTVLPATLAKGLEFDHVVVVEPAEIVEAEPRGANRLYVTLTRAVSRLDVIHERELPSLLTKGATD